ncbi:MAG: hypothetical protein AVDCRST_MAG59-1891 [uncultured Thermomicrobiales bacterium]|uniref:Uncharacterized protein n=1 Tax=uncultured Thermomicrobiales bacterium TaxID=1645740 RepID=A0A6J4UN29_9BACT|nr:MAG: hypothetical protein AVDCRST_MAG59-1891 [uncultured Thermomicrobiales bacterium]
MPSAGRGRTPPPPPPRPRGGRNDRRRGPCARADAARLRPRRLLGDPSARDRRCGVHPGAPLVHPLTMAWSS